MSVVRVRLNEQYSALGFVIPQRNKHTVPIVGTGIALPYITNSWIRVTRRAAGKLIVMSKDSEQIASRGKSDA